MLIIAHRGDTTHAPENSFESFGAAIANGADGIELDVRATSDGVAVVVHDPTLKRTAGSRLRVSKSTCAQIAKARLSNGEGVPTLAEVIERFGGKIALYIELKGRGVVLEAERLALSKPGGRFILSSFDVRALAGVEGARKALLWDKRGSPVATALRLGCSEVHVRIDRLTTKMAETARLKRLAVVAWDVTSRRDVKKATSLRLEGIIVDDIAQAREFVE